MNKITALIPARGGSKGVPRKNIKKLCGHPLLAYSIMVCKLSEKVDKVIVSTEDSEVMDVALQYGAELLIRPYDLATDKTRDYEVIKHFFNKTDTEQVAYVRPTTPLRSPVVFDFVVDLYFANSHIMTGIRSVHELPESPYKLFKINNEGYCEGFFDEFKGIKDYTNLPRQTFPKAYQPNGYIDIVKKQTILNGSSFGTKILPFVSQTAIEVDTEYEFKLLENELLTNGHRLLEELNKN